MKGVAMVKELQQLAGWLAGRIKIGWPWVLVLAISTGVAYIMNTGAVRALSTDVPPDTLSVASRDASNLCTLNVDGALYAGTDRWLPGGRSAFCRADTYPGVSGRNDVASQLGHVGPLQATITFVSPSDIRIDLFCSTSVRHWFADATLVTAAEALDTYEQVCTPGGPSN